MPECKGGRRRRRCKCSEGHISIEVDRDVFVVSFKPSQISVHFELLNTGSLPASALTNTRASSTTTIRPAIQVESPCTVRWGTGTRGIPGMMSELFPALRKQDANAAQLEVFAAFCDGFGQALNRAGEMDLFEHGGGINVSPQASVFKMIDEDRASVWLELHLANTIPAVPNEWFCVLLRTGTEPEKTSLSADFLFFFDAAPAIKKFAEIFHEQVGEITRENGTPVGLIQELLGRNTCVSIVMQSGDQWATLGAPAEGPRQDADSEHADREAGKDEQKEVGDQAEVDADAK
eukprot:m.158193 g.158193  ORF g.158193 m.158193 type:complete len:291 (+) comp14497_c0_seq3:1302-2174(+)